MPQRTEKASKRERVVLEDGRKGYFIDEPLRPGAVLVVKYPTPFVKKRVAGKTAIAKKARHSHVTKSVIKALKEVKSGKVTGDYPIKDFDTLMDEL